MRDINIKSLPIEIIKINEDDVTIGFKTFDKKQFIKEINRLKNIISTGYLFGEFNVNALSPIVELKDVSHIITNIDIVDNVVKIDLTILNTLQGKIVQKIYKETVLMLKPRMLLFYNETERIKDFKIITFDIAI